ncbi:MAG: DinB family protein [Sphingobacteriales bacterium]|nr:DinB family protein [Sphingobacteriales bacterium]
MHTSNFNDTIDTWISALQHYSFDVLLISPGTGSWSLGQVFMHLLRDSNYYAGQIEYCLTHPENPEGQMNEFAKTLFANNAFPDEKIKGDPASSGEMEMPASKADLIIQLNRLKAQLNYLNNKIAGSTSSGKTRHPGLGYFNAREWLQFADMHLRHHLRQKKRIEEALNIRPGG